MKRKEPLTGGHDIFNCGRAAFTHYDIFNCGRAAFTHYDISNCGRAAFTYYHILPGVCQVPFLKEHQFWSFYPKAGWEEILSLQMPYLCFKFGKDWLSLR